MAWRVRLLMGEQLHILDTCSCSVDQSVVSDSFQPHELQHARLPCPLLSPRVCSNSCSWSRRCHPTSSSSIILPLIPSPPAFYPSQLAGSFPMSQFLTSGGQRIGASASASVLPMNIQGWSPLGLTGLISLLSKGLKNLLQHHSLKASVLQHSAFMVQLSHLYMTGKTITLTIQTFISKVMSLLFNMLSRFVIAFIPRSKGISISWMQSPFTVILEPKKIKSVTVST